MSTQATHDEAITLPSSPSSEEVSSPAEPPAESPAEPPVETSSSEELATAPITCVTCRDEMPLDWVVTLGCSHHMCVVCLDMYARSSIELRKFPMSCSWCSTVIAHTYIPSGHLRQVYLDTQTTYNKSRNPDLRPCIMTNCEGYRERLRDSQCDVCGVGYCVKCGDRPTTNHYHLRMTVSRKRKADDVSFPNRLIPCPTCGFGVERISGCKHMTCSRCRTDFCWVCGKLGTGHPDCVDR